MPLDHHRCGRHVELLDHHGIYMFAVKMWPIICVYGVYELVGCCYLYFGLCDLFYVFVMDFATMEHMVIYSLLLMRL
jgi:hypothetical protein